MNSLLGRLVGGAVVAASLTACSVGPNVAPAPREASPSIRIERDGAFGETSSPCKLSTVWYFRGSCSAFSMLHKGTTEMLNAYKGIALTMLWPSYLPKQAPNPEFVGGDAIGSGDITGTYSGKVFPLFGTTKCATPYGQLTRCRGKAFLYTIVVNHGQFEYGWNFTPKITLTNSADYPGAKCHDTLLARSKRGFAWIIFPLEATPRNGKLIFKPVNAPFSLRSGQFDVFGFICY